jgi:hypothetical protein
MSAAPSALQSASQASQKPEGLDDMPDHWKVPKSDGTMLSRIQILAFHALCLVSITRPSLSVHCWVSKRSDEEWERHRKMVCDKLNASNVAVSNYLIYFALDVWDCNFS